MAATSSLALSSLPPLLTVAEIRERLSLIFPSTFPDRTILVGEMAARVIFVFLYGGSIEGNGLYLRPAHIYLFTAEQSHLTSDSQRQSWIENTRTQGYRPAGKRWYADTSREPIRDDLMRNQLLRLGIMQKLPGQSSVSPRPTNYLSAGFAQLFDPKLTGKKLSEAIAGWTQRHLNRSTLQRMALRAKGVEASLGDVLIKLPDSTQIRISAGRSAMIAKAVIEEFAPLHLKNPAVLWISASDKKSYPQFTDLCASVGLKFDLSAELPDIILADLVEPIRIILCEIVATDGPVTEARRKALLRIVDGSHLDRQFVEFLTAFDDRSAAPFKKSFSQLAGDSLVWFRTEPALLVTLETVDS